jgi:hypothetical protein
MTEKMAVVSSTSRVHAKKNAPPVLAMVAPTMPPLPILWLSGRPAAKTIESSDEMSGRHRLSCEQSRVSGVGALEASRREIMPVSACTDLGFRQGRGRPDGLRAPVHRHARSDLSRAR